MSNHRYCREVSLGDESFAYLFSSVSQYIKSVFDRFLPTWGIEGKCRSDIIMRKNVLPEMLI